MSRAIAGVFDPRRDVERWRVAAALSPQGAVVIERGPLCVAHTGPPAQTGELLCLLSGVLDNEAELQAACDGPRSDGREPPRATAEQLLAAGYRRWGERLPAHLLGDFALVIWDGEREQGLLARDQLGVRCLYVYERSGALWFATEVRELLALLRRRPPPDPAGVAHWVAASQRPGAGSLYQGVRRLEAGGALALSVAGTRRWRYWRPRFSAPQERHSGAVLREAHSPRDGAPRDGTLCGSGALREALLTGVRRRLARDGTSAVLMSGGLDSSCVAAIAAREAPDRVAAYAAVFPEHPAVDESALIEELRGALELGGVDAEVRAGGLLASGLESLSAWQLPPASWGDFWALPLLRAAASAGAEVVLGGDGGDELFATRAQVLADLLRAGRTRRALSLARELPGAGDRPRRRALLRALLRFGVLGALPCGVHSRLRRPLAARELPPWLLPATAASLLDSDDPLAWKHLEGPRWWAQAAHGVMRIEEVGVFEMHRHRAALAGVEARHPLLDLGLVEAALAQPPEDSFDRHRNRPVLRAAMAGELPDRVRLRADKARFDSLIVDSLAQARGDRAAVRRLLSDPRAEIGAYVDVATVRRCLLDGDLERRDPFRWMLHTWRLITAECWLRAQAGRDVEAAALGGVSAPRVRLLERSTSPRRRARLVPFSALTERRSAVG